MREHTGTSFAIGIISAFGYTIWAAVLAILVWTSITIYAFVKWIGGAPDDPSATTLLVLVVALVTLFPVLLSLGIYAIGRSMRPPKRKDRLEALPQ
jgi:hypothetical protein